MNNGDNSMKQIFDLADVKALEDRFSGAESQDRVLSLKQKVMGTAKGLKWAVARGEVVKRIGDLLGIPIPDILLRAWDKCGALHRYADKKKYPPEETVLVPLVKHTIRSVHEPYLEILVNGEPVGRIDFQVSISLNVDGITLKIRGGRIMEIETGTCVAQGAITCEKITIVEQKTKPIKLPGVIPLGEGIPV